jgi:hypothetical protein
MKDVDQLSAMSEVQRQVYVRLADELIPEGEGMLSASQAEVPTHWIDVAMAIRPDLRVSLLEALNGAGPEDPALCIEWLIRELPAAFEALETLTAGAYFLSPTVRTLAGYPGQETREFIDEVPLYLVLLERVVERGPIFRPTPGDVES